MNEKREREQRAVARTVSQLERKDVEMELRKRKLSIKGVDEELRDRLQRHYLIELQPDNETISVYADDFVTSVLQTNFQANLAKEEAADEIAMRTERWRYEVGMERAVKIEIPTSRARLLRKLEEIEIELCAAYEAGQKGLKEERERASPEAEEGAFQRVMHEQQERNDLLTCKVKTENSDSSTSFEEKTRSVVGEGMTGGESRATQTVYKLKVRQDLQADYQLLTREKHERGSSEQFKSFAQKVVRVYEPLKLEKINREFTQEPNVVTAEDWTKQGSESSCYTKRGNREIDTKDFDEPNPWPSPKGVEPSRTCTYNAYIRDDSTLSSETERQSMQQKNKVLPDSRFALKEENCREGKRDDKEMKESLFELQGLRDMSPKRPIDQRASVKMSLPDLQAFSSSKETVGECGVFSARETLQGQGDQLPVKSREIDHERKPGEPMALLKSDRSIENESGSLGFRAEKLGIISIDDNALKGRSSVTDEQLESLGVPNDDGLHRPYLDLLLKSKSRKRSRGRKRRRMDPYNLKSQTDPDDHVWGNSRFEFKDMLKAGFPVRNKLENQEGWRSAVDVERNRRFPPRTTGIFFNNLRIIPTNPCLDPPLGVCFICRQKGHKASQCSRERLGLYYCTNCGRRGVTIPTCERCAEGLQIYEKQRQKKEAY